MRQELHDLIGALRRGDIDENGFAEALARGPLRMGADGDLTLDHHRWIRQGFGEVVLALTEDHRGWDRVSTVNFGDDGVMVAQSFFQRNL